MKIEGGDTQEMVTGLAQDDVEKEGVKTNEFDLLVTRLNKYSNDKVVKMWFRKNNEQGIKITERVF